MKILRSFFLISLMMLGGCFSPESVTRNIRVIAQAEVDGKIVEGSAVMSLRWEAGSNGRVYGTSNVEAVTLKLNDDFAIYITHAYLSNDGTSNRGYWSSYVPSALGISGSVSKENFKTIKTARGKFKVLASISRTKLLPLMVAFTDKQKRETMYEITPLILQQKTFQSIKFLGLWFEFTDEQETMSVKENLPIMFKPNESFIGSFPNRDNNGKLIPSRNKALPQKIGTPAFFQRDF